MALITAVTLGPPLFAILWHRLLVPFVAKIRTSGPWLVATLFVMGVGKERVFFAIFLVSAVVVVVGGISIVPVLEFWGFMRVIQDFAPHLHRVTSWLSSYLALRVLQVWHSRYDAQHTEGSESATNGISPQLLASQKFGEVIVIQLLIVFWKA